MKLPMWKKLGLPSPIRPTDKLTHKRTCPYRIYRIWQKMKVRGGNHCPSFQRDRHAKYYAHVVICDEWSSFENFYRWAMTHGYREELTLDRIDWRRGYCRENCRWATYHEQRHNRRDYKKNVK